MSDGKACTFCKVGWMGRHRARDAKGIWWIVWLCKACGHQEQDTYANYLPEIEHGNRG